MSNYAVVTEGSTVDVYSTIARAEARAKAIAGVATPADARPLSPFTVARFRAVSGFRHKSAADPDSPVWIVPTEEPVTDDTPDPWV